MTAVPLTPPRRVAGRALATLLGVVLAVAALKVGRPVLAPLVAGIFLAMLAQPLRARLARVVPDWLALTIAGLALVAGVLAFLGALGWALSEVGRELADRREALTSAADRARAWASQHGISIGGGGQGGGGSSGGASSVAGPVGRALGALGSALTELGLALAVAVLAMAEEGELRRRFRQALSDGSAQRTLAIVDESAQAFRRYVWVKTLTSLLTGAASAGLALAFGLPLAWVWGLFSFLLEYVPTIGSLLAVVPPTLMALAESAGGGGGGLGRVGAVFLAFGAMQIVLGNVVDPKLEGRLMQLSPLGVLVSIVFWGWLWGALGALLAVPLTVAIAIAARHVPGMGGVATVLAGDDVDDVKGVATRSGSGADDAREPRRDGGRTA
jgi:predicted PurR-regulated permease PerM